MGRRYGRIALGGVRDEAEIRGHRRTYVGALPGRIVQALKKAASKNPVLVLDEVDKMGVDVRGDPAAALLEVLDPAQNDSFVDHYLGVPFDLSEVTFLATANYRSSIPDALRDRMELIEVPGYTRADKWHIAERFLVPKQLKAHGLTTSELVFTQDGLQDVIDLYTREAGVRSLEREIAAICRDMTVRLAEGRPVVDVRVTPELVEELLGAPRFNPEVVDQKFVPGVALGMSVGPAGGDVMFIEATRMPGKGNIRLTGSMRKVMEESAATAVSYVRSRADRLHLDPEWLKRIDLHLHIPRGGGAQDAASAGVAMFLAVTSLLLDVPLREDVTVVGEITLRGSILPVSGVKAMVLAAHRAKIREIVLPARNERDLEEVPQEVRDDIRIHFVSRVEQVLPLVLKPPEPAQQRPAPAANSPAHP
jgi:ATP-dependent Lon protease